LNGLPAPAPEFVARDEVLADLLGLLNPDRAASGQRIVGVSAVAGLAGVGKTELVVQTAHAALAKGWFSGGVLMVDLHGYEDPPMRLDSARALNGLLEALSVPGEHIPADAQDRQRMYRAILSDYAAQGRPILVVIDNASPSAPAEPLLPGAGAALVTSRHSLDLKGRLLELPVLADQDAVELLGRLLTLKRGPAEKRVADDAAAAAQVGHLCAGLPLAVEIVAALLAAHPTKPLSEMARQLEAEHTRLTEMRYENKAVRAAFALSYACLDPEHARLFRLLSLNPGPDFSTQTAVVLARAHTLGIVAETAENRLFRSMTFVTMAEQGATRRALEALAQAHLIDAGTYGRWQMHDLVRLFATEQSRAKAKQDKRSALLQLLLLYYTVGARAASAHLEQTISDAAAWGFPDEQQALNWLDAEYRNLIATAHATVGNRSYDVIAVDLPLTLFHIMSLRYRFDDAIALAPIALKAARRLRRPEREAVALRNLGSALVMAGRFDESVTVMQDAIKTFRKIGNQQGEATTLTNLGGALISLRQYEDAVTTLQDAVRIHREAGARYSEGVALNNLGNSLIFLERFEEAIDALRKAAQIHRELGDQRARGNALGGLGEALRHADQLEEAAVISRRAAKILHAAQDWRGEATALTSLGSTLREMEQFEDAILTLQDALQIACDLNDRHGQAGAQMSLGQVLQAADRLAESLTAYRQAVILYSETADRHGESTTLYALGAALHQSGQIEEAITATEQSLAVCRESGDRRDQAQRLAKLAVMLCEVNRLSDAVAACQEAAVAFAEVSDEYGHAQTTQLSAELEHLLASSA